MAVILCHADDFIQHFFKPVYDSGRHFCGKMGKHGRPVCDQYHDAADLSGICTWNDVRKRRKRTGSKKTWRRKKKRSTGRLFFSWVRIRR